MMRNNSVKNLAAAALFAALSCVFTMAIRIPTPGTGGYIHPGDAVVILSGIFLDPVTAFLAAGIGSCMADFRFLTVQIIFLLITSAWILNFYRLNRLKIFWYRFMLCLVISIICL